jgi:hypothetical protein
MTARKDGIYLKQNQKKIIMNRKFKINNHIGYLIEINGNIGLIKFSFGQFCFNMSLISNKEIS